jgi:3-hydroxyisobutyrate dehydrogenase-like beta-hydroxyacid dehydrogenase
MQRLEQRGAKRAASPADVASQCETILVSLPTPDVVKAVAYGKNGVIEGSKAKVFVDLSTTGSGAAKEVAAALATKGITAVDAPVSGGPTGAEKGTLAMMIAAPRAIADELRPVIEVLGKFFHIGEEPGLGQTMKVINNLMSAAAQLITAEAMVMGVKAGLDPTTMLDVINAGSGRNTASEDKFPRCVVPRRFDFGFPTALLYKDVKLCLDEAEALGVPMVVGNAVRQLMSIGKAAMGPTADITEFVKPIEQWAGVEVGKKA